MSNSRRILGIVVVDMRFDPRTQPLSAARTAEDEHHTGRFRLQKAVQSSPVLRDVVTDIIEEATPLGSSR
jgi:hypothetical protein